MGPRSILLVFAFALLAICTTAAKRGHTRMLKVSSTDFAQANDAVSNKVRLLRSSEIDDKETNDGKGEGPFSFSSLEERGVPFLNTQMLYDRSRLNPVDDANVLSKTQSFRNVAESGNPQVAKMKQTLLNRRKSALDLHPDITPHFDTFVKWFKEGKTPKTLKNEEKIKALDQSPLPDRFQNNDYRQYVTYVKFNDIINGKSPSAIWLQMERFDEVMSKKAQLTSYTNINDEFGNFRLWYVKGNTVDDAYKKLRLDYLKDRPVVERFKNKDYRRFVSYETFDNIMKNKKPSTLQLQMERYDAVMLKKELLTSNPAFNKDFDNLRNWYVQWNTPEAVKKELKMWRVSAKFGITQQNQLYRKYVRFYKTMNKETAA